jgi:peptidoglycan/LPS O-acetylase OafA/YrhL
MLPWTVAVVAGFFALGAVWERRRAGGPASRFVERASDRSFGVFLVHPTILWALTVAGATSPAALLPTPWSTLAAYAVAVVGSLVVVEALRHTPLSLALTGKPGSYSQPVPRRIEGFRPASPATVGPETRDPVEVGPVDAGPEMVGPEMVGTDKVGADRTRGD